MLQIKSSRRAGIITALVLAVVGVLLILYHTRNGPGITGDSVHYVMGAQNLIHGRGYARTGGGGEAIPITGFPPGYSAVLAVVDLVSVDIFNGARILNALLFGLNIFLVALLIVRYSGSIWLAGLGGAFILLSEDLIHIHAWVMSEPLYIALFLLALVSMLKYLGSGRRGPLVLAALFVAGSILTRYVGVSLLGAAGLAILLLRRTTWKTRVLDAALFGILAVLPVVAWFARNATVSETLTNRVLLYHPISRDLLEVFLGTMNAWFFPLGLGVSRLVRAFFSALLAAVIPAGFILLLWREHRQDKHVERPSSDALPWLLIFYLPLYLFALYANSTFFDAATTPFGASRYLDPAFVAAVLLLLTAGWRLWNSLPARSALRSALLALPVLILGLYAIRAVDYVRDPGADFRYTDSKRQMTALTGMLETLPGDQILISNDIELLYGISERTAYAFPIAYDLYQERYREDFDEQVAFTETQLKEGALIVLFTPLDDTAHETLVQLHAVEIQAFEGAMIFAHEP